MQQRAARIGTQLLCLVCIRSVHPELNNRIGTQQAWGRRGLGAVTWMALTSL